MDRERAIHEKEQRRNGGGEPEDPALFGREPAAENEGNPEDREEADDARQRAGACLLCRVVLAHGLGAEQAPDLAGQRNPGIDEDDVRDRRSAGRVLDGPSRLQERRAVAQPEVDEHGALSGIRHGGPRDLGGGVGNGREGVREVLARDGPEQLALALGQSGPDGAAEQAAQDPVPVEGFEEDLRRSVQRRQRSAPREVGSLLGLGRVGCFLCEEARSGQERPGNREENAGLRARPRCPDQCPVAVSVEPGRA